MRFQELLLEGEFIINRNPGRKTWQIRKRQTPAGLLDETPAITLINAEPFIVSKPVSGVRAFIEGDEYSGEVDTSDQRQIYYVNDKTRSNPFVYRDSLEPYTGSKYIVFQADGQVFAID